MLRLNRQFLRLFQGRRTVSIHRMLRLNCHKPSRGRETTQVSIHRMLRLNKKKDVLAKGTAKVSIHRMLRLNYLALKISLYLNIIVSIHRMLRLNKELLAIPLSTVYPLFLDFSIPIYIFVLGFWNFSQNMMTKAICSFAK